MVQFSATAHPLPTPQSGFSIDDATWAFIRQALAAQGEHHLSGGTLLRSPAGAALYVVVVEREGASGPALPTVEQVRGRFGVTAREAEVALLCSRRLSVDEMAAELGVTRHTVRRHVERVLVKLGVSRRREVGPVLESLAAEERVAAASAASAEQARRARRLQVMAA